jgi:hypothetical protein
MANYVDNGTYRAKALDAKWSQSKANKDQVLVEFEIKDEGAAKGKRITWYGSLSGKAEARTIEALMHCGWDGDFDNLRTVGEKECQIVIDNEEWEGKTRSKVKWVNRCGSSGIAAAPELAPEHKQSLRERMAAQVAAKLEELGLPKPAEKKQERQPGDDDGVPF